MYKYLKMLKVYGFIALGILVLFSGFGFLTSGVPGLLNALNLGLIVCAIGLPFLGVIISITYWSGLPAGGVRKSIKSNWKANLMIKRIRTGDLIRIAKSGRMTMKTRLFLLMIILHWV